MTKSILILSLICLSACNTKNNSMSTAPGMTGNNTQQNVAAGGSQATDNQASTPSPTPSSAP